ncbi:MAG: class I SAM-dependent methyltransferase [Candidatus Hydrogenedentes bacterium]|nr:class I SAM-dependent methyltransferase [Candidatus Hydrogenedentota bacterium]
MEYGGKEWFEHMFSPASQGEDLWGHQWRAIQRYRYLITFELVRECLSARSGQRILDLGCGLGDFTAMLHGANPGNDVCGIDIAETAVAAAARRFPEISFTSGALPEVQAPGLFDGISALECINYLASAERNLAMRNIAARLREGGWFLFSGHLSRAKADARYFSEAEVLENMRNAGFTIHTVKFNYAVLYSYCESPFLRAANLAAKLEDPAAVAGGRLGRALRAPAMGSVLRLAVRATAIPCKFVLRFLQPVAFIRFMQWTGRCLLGEKGKSHIIVLGIKEAGGASSHGE